MTLTTTLTKKQFHILEGIAYRQADKAYMLERYSFEEIQDELKENKRTIYLLFDEADNAKIPFWVQNLVLEYAEDWRRYKSMYLSFWLKRKGVTLKDAG